MIKLCVVAFIATSFLLCTHGVVYSQTKTGNVLSKKFTKSEILEGVAVSQDGSGTVLEFENAFWGISLKEGKTLWTRKIEEDLDHKLWAVYWLSADEVVVPTDKHLEWIEFSTGKTIAKMELKGGGLEDMIPWKYATGYLGEESIAMHRHGNILMVPSDEGYTFVDLKNRRKLFDSDEDIENARREMWGSTMLFHGDMDTAVIVDVVEPRVIYRHNADVEEIEKENFQNLVRYKDELILFIEENILCINAKTGARIGKLGVDPSEAVAYSPVIVGGKLQLLYQTEEDLRLFDISTAKTVWTQKKNVDALGFMMEAWTIPGGDILMTTSNEDDQIFVRRITPSTGAKVWSQRIVESEHEFFAGHRFDGGKAKHHIVVSAGNFSRTVPIMRKVPNFDTDSTGVHSYHQQVGGDSTGPYTDEQELSAFTHHLLHEGAVVNGTVRYIGATKDEILLFAEGRVRKAWEGKISEGVDDGEGVLKLDPITGKVKSFFPIAFCKDHDIEQFDLAATGQPKFLPSGVLLFGTHTIAFVKKDGSVDTVGFNVEEDASWFTTDAGVNYMTVKYEDIDEKHITWRLTWSDAGLTKELVAISEADKYFAQFYDTTFVPVTLRWFNDAIEAYPVQKELPKKWDKPLWTLNQDQLEELGVGDLEVESSLNTGHGIHQHEKVIFLLGDDGVAIVDAKTGCAKKMTLESSPSDGIREIIPLRSGGFYFNMGEDVGLARSAGCNIDVVGKKVLPYEDRMVIVNEHYSLVFVADHEENILDVFRLTP